MADFYNLSYTAEEINQKLGIIPENGTWAGIFESDPQLIPTIKDKFIDQTFDATSENAQSGKAIAKVFSYVTPQMFNFKVGVSTEDATKAIQDAVDYCYENGVGGTIFFPAGTYIVTEPIELHLPADIDAVNEDRYTKNVFINLVGEKYSSIIKGSGSLTSLFTICDRDATCKRDGTCDGTCAGAKQKIMPYQELYVDSLTFDGSNTVSTSFNFVENHARTANVVFRNSNFKYFTEAGLKYEKEDVKPYYGWHYWFKIENCIFKYNRNGMCLGHDDMLISSTEVAHNTYYGIIINDIGANITFNNCKIQYNGKRVADNDDGGLALYKGGQVKIEGRKNGSSSSHAISFNDCYFENKSDSDVSLNNNGIILVDAPDYVFEIKTLEFKGCYTNIFGGVSFIDVITRNAFIENLLFTNCSFTGTSTIAGAEYNNEGEIYYDETSYYLCTAKNSNTYSNINLINNYFQHDLIGKNKICLNCKTLFNPKNVLDQISQLSTKVDNNAGPSFVASDTNPTNTNVLWIDTSENGGLKYHNGTDWVTVPVRFS